MRSLRHSSHYSSRKDNGSDTTPTNLFSLPPSISLTLSSSQPLPVLSFAAPPIPSPPIFRSPTSSPMAFSFAKPKPVVTGSQMMFPGSSGESGPRIESSSLSVFPSSVLTKKTSTGSKRDLLVGGCITVKRGRCCYSSYRHSGSGIGKEKSKGHLGM